MAVKIRLRRISATSKKRYNYRAVVIEGACARDGKVIEEIGHYDAAKKPAVVKIDRVRYEHWVKLGAQPSATIKSLMRKIK
ncbi:MAG: 30S ribosomal protein S16 [Candidatus Omnitrophota bacterium]